MYPAVIAPHAPMLDVAILVRGNREVCFVPGGIG